MLGQKALTVGAELDGALAVLEETAETATGHRRQDLVERLRATRRRAMEPTVRVLVVGEYKQGKSSLVNALLNAPVCPVDDDVATCVPTLVRFSAEPQVLLYGEGDEEPVSESVPLTELAAHVTEAGNPGNGRGLRLVSVGLPRRLLADGLELVDTPGVGGLGSAHTALTIGALPTADAVLFVSDASQELSAPELAFLRRAREACPTVAFVLTKVDVYPEWRRIAELDREHLRRAGLTLEILPVASPLRSMATRTEDRELNEESGFPPLVARLHGLLAGAEQLAVRSVANDLLWVCSRLGGALASERSALANPEGARDLVARLEHTREEVGALRSRSARWQLTLNDGVADLAADVDHDFRGRTREVLRTAEEAIESSDPAETWEEFEPWLTRRVAYEAAENYALLADRARELAALVADHFGASERELTLALEVEPPSEMLGDLAVRNEMSPSKGGIAGLGLVGLRGAYGGVLMFSMLGRMIGLAAIIANPLTVGATILLSGKAIRDHRARELTARRQQARAAVRQYVDDVTFQVGKDSRDTLRRIQRELRDTFSARAEELQRSTAEALEGATRALESDRTEREGRLRTVEGELRRIAALRARVVALAPELDERTAVGS